MEAEQCRQVPNALLLAEMFGPLEEMGVECDVTKALGHLRAAKRAFLDARNESMRRRNQQTLITEFLQTLAVVNRILPLLISAAFMDATQGGTNA